MMCLIIVTTNLIGTIVGAFLGFALAYLNFDKEQTDADRIKGNNRGT